MSSSSSFPQQSIWLSPGNSSSSSIFNLLWSLRFNGPLNTDLLFEALSNILTRQAALRSTFRWTGAMLELMTVHDIQLELFVESLKTSDISSANAEIESIGHVFGSDPYDLEQGPLYRFKLIRVSEFDHVLLCGFHHLVIDGTSWKLFVDELIEILGRNRTLEPVTSYAEYIQWQKCQVNSDQWIKACNHWNKLAKKSHSYKLPGSKVVSRFSNYAGAQVVFRLDAATNEALRNASLKSGISPFRLALTAFLSFLYSLSRQEGLFVATTLVGRPSAAYKKTLGLFVNTTLVGLNTAHQATFNSLVTDINLQLIEALKHESYPYYFAIRDSEKKRDFSRDLLVPVSFTKLPSSFIRNINDLSIREQRIFLNVADRDLSVYMQDVSGDFHFTWVYRSDLFESASILRYAEEFQCMLLKALENPQQPILDFEIVTTAERRTILTEWNQTDKSFSQSKCLHLLIQEQTMRTPDRVAIVTPNRTYTYKCINDLSNRFANYLRARGIGYGHYIPLILKSSAELMLAELSVIKTGAAFCPIDSDWPTSRIQSLLKQLGSRFVVIGSPFEKIYLDQQYEMILMSDFMHEEDSELSTNMAMTTIPESMVDLPLYCLFTSGSTGDPKGAINLHRGIVNRLFAMNDLFGSAKDDTILATASANVDTLVWQYFWPLISGGRCIVVPKEEVIDPEGIVRLFKQHSITFTDFVPSVFQLLVNYLDLHPEALSYFGKLRQVLIGGDIFPAEAAKKFQILLPHVAITNSYGPTETSIGVIFHEYDSEDPHSMAIGRPIANVKTVVVDDEFKLRPIGAVGELCLGGTCVGLGYLSNPELTKQKFIINPFPELGCPTLYRTGDLVRYRSNGVLEFLGRIDDQLKIHGIRIEPSEIEAALMGHPLIAEALVLCTTDKQGVKQLVAYVCSHDINMQLKQSVLRQFLMGELPRYMIPTTFVQVPALPLTSGGKLNRTPHEILHARVLNDQRTYVAPRNTFETQIVEMWIDILSQKNIGINDHFFSDLGGDSLSGMLFVARFKSQTGIDLDILTLYEYSTPALFTEYLMKEQNTVKLIPPSHSNYSIFKKQRLYVSNWRGRQSKPDSFLFTLNETGINPTLFWCFQGYEEFHELSKRMGTSQPITGMRSGHQIMQYTDENIEALASQYAGEMVQLQPTGAFIIGGNCQGAVIAEATARVLIASGRLVSLLILMEHSDLKPYDGQVAFIFGRDSRLNPYRDQSNSVILFKQRLLKDYTVDFIDGAHGEFFSRKNLSSLSNVLTNLMASVSR